MVHGLATQLGGGMTISSTPGFGTTIALWLPVSAEAAKAADGTDPSTGFRAVGTALLVDDDELVRLTTAGMLTEIGYAVIEAASAEDALRILQSGIGIDLIVTDHLMTGLTGTQLASLAQEKRPGLPVLIVSGYAELDGIAAHLPRLLKPFRQADLEASIAELRLSSP